MNFKFKNREGFTMIELLVAMGLFSIVVSIASATFVQSLRAQRQIVALMAANDNAGLALEQIVREIRTGKEFSTVGTSLSFINYLNESVTYNLNGQAIERNNKPITASSVKVHYLNFALFGEDVDDGKSTRVTIALGISAPGLLEEFITNLQTTVSARTLDS